MLRAIPRKQKQGGNRYEKSHHLGQKALHGSQQLCGRNISLRKEFNELLCSVLSFPTGGKVIRNTPQDPIDLIGTSPTPTSQDIAVEPLLPLLDQFNVGQHLAARRWRQTSCPASAAASCRPRPWPPPGRCWASRPRSSSARKPWHGFSAAPRCPRPAGWT